MPSVWIVNHYAQGPDLPGGTRHYELARRLADRGWTVTLIASSFHHATRTQSASSPRRGRVEQTDGLSILWVPSRTSYRVNDASRATNMLEFALRARLLGCSRLGRAIPQPDVVVGSSPHLFAAWAAAGLAARFRVPFVFEVRDLWPETIVQMGVLPRRHPIVCALAVIERRLYRRAAQIVSLLPSIGDYLRPLGIATDNLAVVPNGVDLAAFAARPQRPLVGPLRVVYVGAHGPANGLGNILSAAANLADGIEVEFHLTGSGPEKAALVERARTEGLASVHFHDAVPKSGVPEILAGADVLLLNYARIGIGKYGISPNKLWEYMAAARPVVFAHEAAEDPVQAAQCGLSVPPEDPDALAAAIAQLAAMSAEERQAMGERGRAYVAAHHDWDLLAARLAGVLEGVIARRVMGPRRERTTDVD
ncbi:MAG: glycosyltransferase family 4 protein [Candidatus Bipolaricaulota bacterium]